MTDINRRAVVKGSAWAVPVILTAAAAPTIAASVTEQIDVNKSCKIPAQRQASDYRLYLNLSKSHTVLGVKIDGENAETWSPLAINPQNNVLTVATISNANSQVFFEVICNDVTLSGYVKALPCKD